MIEFKKGDLFKSDADVLVNTVNCVGVMGKGIALQFKERYPEMFELYATACRGKTIKPGNIYVWQPEDGKWIVNFTTKAHWRNPSQYTWIKSGLRELRKFIKTSLTAEHTVALPALGCSNGKLEWNIVKKIIEDKLRNLEPTIFVYEPL